MIVQVETKHIVAEVFANVEKITGATAEIENLKGRSAIEPNILCAFNVNSHPVRNVGETVDLGRVRALRIPGAKLGHLAGIERFQNTL